MKLNFLTFFLKLWYFKVALNHKQITLQNVPTIKRNLMEWSRTGGALSWSDQALIAMDTTLPSIEGKSHPLDWSNRWWLGVGRSLSPSVWDGTGLGVLCAPIQQLHEATGWSHLLPWNEVSVHWWYSVIDVSVPSKLNNTVDVLCWCPEALGA